MKLIALSVLVGVGAFSSASLINGGFEDPGVGIGSYATYGNGDTSITGWTVVGAQVLVVDSAYGEPGNGIVQFQANSGRQYLDLTGAGNNGTTSGVTQSISTVANQQYTVSWWQANSLSNNGAPYYQASSVVDLSIDGGSRVSYTSLGSFTGSNDWSLQSASFVASGASTSITFYNGYGGGDNNNIGIDDVSVEAVPEPATLAILGLGLAAIKRRRA